MQAHPRLERWRTQSAWAADGHASTMSGQTMQRWSNSIRHCGR